MSCKLIKTSRAFGAMFRYLRDTAKEKRPPERLYVSVRVEEEKNPQTDAVDDKRQKSVAL